LAGSICPYTSRCRHLDEADAGGRPAIHDVPCAAQFLVVIKLIPTLSAFLSNQTKELGLLAHRDLILLEPGILELQRPAVLRYCANHVKLPAAYKSLSTPARHRGAKPSFRTSRAFPTRSLFVMAISQGSWALSMRRRTSSQSLAATVNASAVSAASGSYGASGYRKADA
jgi:hypothetical protein